VTTAHPHHDFDRDELVNYHAFFSRVSKYVLYGLPAGSSTRRVIAELPVKQPSYMHAFGMSGQHLILAEYPLRVNPLKLAFSGKPFIENYVWNADEGTKFQVVDRETGKLRGTYTTDAFFCFHHVNAFERAGGSELVIDLVAYDDASIIDALYLDDEGVRGPFPRTELRRYVIDLEGGGVTWEKLGENVELPRINYGSHNTRPYRYAYFAGTGGEWIDHLAKIDLEDGTRLEWSAPDCYPGEPVFVREPGAADEDAGVVLSVVLDAAAGRSFLLVLDARSFEELARAEAPHHIPFGFHGQFVRDSG
jgi:carotenoid cleavage dioxygenase-like enzyme